MPVPFASSSLAMSAMWELEGQVLPFSSAALQSGRVLSADIAEKLKAKGTWRYNMCPILTSTQLQALHDHMLPTLHDHAVPFITSAPPPTQFMHSISAPPPTQFMPLQAGPRKRASRSLHGPSSATTSFSYNNFGTIHPP